MVGLDLHLHTEKSDGENSVENIIGLVKKSGVKIFSITDHDTISGYLEAQSIKNNLILIPGVEISTYDREKDVDVDILGYCYNPENEKLLDLLDYIKRENSILNDDKIQALKSKGVNISLEDVLKAANGRMISKHHFAQALKDTNYLNLLACANEKNPYLFLKKYTKSPKTKVQPRDAIEAIASAGGIAVVAHIFHTMRNHSKERAISTIKKYISYGLGGIEVYYPAHNQEQIKILEEICSKNGILATCGSDFHGPSSTNGIGDIQMSKEKAESLSLKLLELVKKSN